VTPTPYWYRENVRRLITQFMCIFKGLQVNNGSEFQIVPITSAEPDIVVASIIAGNTPNASLALPLMSCKINGYQYDNMRAAGLNQSASSVRLPVGGQFPDDLITDVIYKPLPVTLSVDLYVYTTNFDQMFQIIEQIMPLFSTALSLQTNTSALDPARISSVEMTNGFTLDGNFPIGNNQRACSGIASFDIKGYQPYPEHIIDNVIKSINLRIGASGGLTNFDIIDDFNAQGLEYTKIHGN